MKKLMIAAAIVCAAVVSQAATANWDWKTSYSGKIYQAGSTTATIASGTAYIFALTTDFSQQDVLDAFGGNSDWKTGNLSNKSVDKGAIAGKNATDFQYGTDSTKYSFFLALVDGDKIFISDAVAMDPDFSSYKVLSFDEKAASQKAASDSSTFTAGGWYAAVPEPTSGLLLLLGVAGLALKRRRA